MYFVNGHNVFIIVFVTFLCSLIATPIVKRIAVHIKALDYPNARRLNKVPMPTIGGLAIFFSFMLGYMLYARSSIQMLSILMGSFLLFCRFKFKFYRTMELYNHYYNYYSTN